MLVTIEVGDLTLTAELDGSETAQAVAAALPLSGSASVWGDEIYFSTPITLAEAADAQEEVAVGSLAYWPPGKAVCLFFGPTPVSRGSEPRAYSPVNVFGRIVDDATQLRAVRNGAPIRIASKNEAD